MSVKWNGRVIEDIDPRPLLEKILVKYHMYIDKEVSHHAVIRQVGKTWNMLEEEAYKQKSVRSSD